jgi:exosortase A-associated hydrolase 2
MSANFDIEPFFLDSPRGPLFCLLLSPKEGEPKGCVLYLHPFGEEMHKSRRMAAIQARTLADAGYLVLMPDLTGCGDSHGDFGDASWQAWLEDARNSVAWLASHYTAPVTLWGLRTGATLAVHLSLELQGIQALLLWQPVTNGEIFLNQFLRIKLASEMLAEGQAQSGTKALRAKLVQGHAIEVGGNMLSPTMANELSAILLANMQPTSPVFWIDIGGEASDTLIPANKRIADKWLEKGVSLKMKTVLGDPFWLTQEISECLPLIKESTNALKCEK